MSPLQSADMYRSIFENAIEGIFQTTPSGQYLNVNPALAKMYGYASTHDLIAGLNREIMTHYARAWDMRSACASNGMEALKLLRQAAVDDPYELVILDMQMPHMDGLMLAREIILGFRSTAHTQVDISFW